MTVETRHTPGPWRIGDAGTAIFGPPNGEPSPITIANLGRARGDYRANARLIAAAPALLDALDAALHAIETPGDFTADEIGYVIEDAAAAIAQARGEA